MTSQITYIVFLKNTQTNEEFTTPTSAPDNAHDVAMGQIRQQYKAPQFKVHTAYTEIELRHTLDGLSRWPGLASQVQIGAVKPKMAPVKVSLMQAVKQATSATVEAVSTPKVEKPALIQAVRAAVPMAGERVVPLASKPVATVAETIAAKQTPSSTGESVLFRLKAMQK